MKDDKKPLEIDSTPGIGVVATPVAQPKNAVACALRELADVLDRQGPFNDHAVTTAFRKVSADLRTRASSLEV